MKRLTIIVTVVVAIVLAAAVSWAESQTYLGVRTVPTNPEVADHLRLEPGVGLTVQLVDPDSPAAGKLEPMDIVYKFDDQILIDPRQLAVLVRSREPGDKAVLSIYRSGEASETSVVLSEREVAAPKRRAYGMGQAAPRRMRPHPFGGGMDLDDMRREMEERMNRFQDSFGAMDRMLEDLRKRMNAEPGAGKGVQYRQNSIRISRIENGMRFDYTSENGDRHLKVVDSDGDVVFDGPINTEEELGEVPQEAVRFLDSIDIDIEYEAEDKVELIPKDAI